MFARLILLSLVLGLAPASSLAEDSAPFFAGTMVVRCPVLGDDGIVNVPPKIALLPDDGTTQEGREATRIPTGVLRRDGMTTFRVPDDWDAFYADVFVTPECELLVTSGFSHHRHGTAVMTFPAYKHPQFQDGWTGVEAKGVVGPVFVVNRDQIGFLGSKADQSTLIKELIDSGYLEPNTP